MSTEESEIKYLVLDKNNVRFVNRILLTTYYVLIIILIYQFIDGKKFKRSLKMYFIFFFFIIFPLVMPYIQSFFYKLGRLAVIYIYRNVYVLDY